MIACLRSFGVSKNGKSMKMLVVLADMIALAADDSCRQQMPSVGILRIGTNKNGGGWRQLVVENRLVECDISSEICGREPLV